MFRKLWDVFIAFTRASNLGFGGGPSLIPLIKAEAVDRYQWMDNEEFADSLAIGNALPGPIATKMAAYIGYKVAGWLGAFVAIFGTIAPTAIIVILLGSLLVRYSDSPELQAMLKAVRPVVVILVAETAYDMAKKAFPSVSTWGIAAITIALLYFVDIHPAFIIVTAMLFGWAAYGRAKK
ncbi:chromate transport protein ChrA [Desulfosporosinus orientis DSM 765]|uniref:Chromate transport protein ChrA n=1 Tax=Desulfosporosinus orientis (strain ATCC 19365 / DSM 765 / NCIMB 8382 / VKM B-1628 / Singapore I) TaxID=768706 RepID=G7WCN7_DESOD|nr:chromate transporter [Desulfosporosinus orientis]AET66575.1 chromate transport protein ChrA [Desulfosporosinus orientis DSM 765]